MREEHLRWALEAYNFRPSRAEALADLSTYFREHGQNALAVVFAEAAMAVELPADHLFVEKPAYTWGPRRDFSICAFYDHRKLRRGYEVCDSLITDAEVPDHIRAEARSNMFFYLRPLAEFCKSFKATRITWTPDEPKWAVTNPSVTRFLCNTLVCLRAVNYRIRDDGSYDMQGDDAIRTGNYLFRLDDDTLIPLHQIVWSRPAPAFRQVIGLEDMRIFANDGRLMFIACAREQRADGLAQQVLGEIDHETGQIVSYNTITVEPQRHEKNWMPIPFTAPMKFVYRPSRIVDAHGGTVRTFDDMAGIDHFSGGSQLISFNGGYLAITHESCIRPGHTKRFYQHRFVWFDTQYRLAKWTLPFYLNAPGIEFVAGLTQDVRGNILISYGVNDAEAWIATLDPIEVGYLLWRR